MAIETYVNGSKNGCITFINDHEPCSVYVDGEKQTNISYTGESIQGSPSVKYASEYKKNLISMIVEGNTVQNGTPALETPIPIHNAGDNGLECVLRGYNLFDQEKAIDSSYWKGTQYKKFTPIVFKKGVRYTVTIGKNLCNSIDYPFDTETVAIVINANGGWNGILIGNTSSGIRYGTKFSVYSKNSDLYLWTYVKGISYEQFFTEVIKEMQIVEGTEAFPYEPYFEPTTVEIPNEVTLEGGEVVPLRLGRHADSADKIVVDKSAKSVKYIKSLGYLRLSSSQNFKVYIYGTSYLGIELDNCLEQRLQRALGICSHSRYVGDYWSGNNLLWLGVNNSTTLYWVGILDLLGIVDGWADKWNPTAEEKTTAIEKFKEWLDEQDALGTPVEILYQLKDTVEYSLTETELGQALLNLPTQNQTNVIEVTPSNIDNPNVSNISVTYAKWGGKTNEN